jgi:hypothetical protein
VTGRVGKKPSSLTIAQRPQGNSRAFAFQCRFKAPQAALVVTGLAGNHDGPIGVIARLGESAQIGVTKQVRVVDDGSSVLGRAR